MTYHQALKLKRYLLDNYDSNKCSVQIHQLSQCDVDFYKYICVPMYGVYAIRIYVHVDESIAEYANITKYTVKSMRSLMLDCKNGLY